MTLENVLVWLKTFASFQNYYIGILDSKKDKSLGIYNLKSNLKPIVALGGLDNTSYNVKRVSLLVHWNNAYNESESKAISLYENIMHAKPQKIGDKEVSFIGMLVNEPVDVGRDDKGICEFVIEFDIYYKRK